MSTPTDKAKDPVGIPVLSWFITEDEYKQHKQVAQTLSTSFTALKGDVDFIKGALTVLSVGLTGVTVGIQPIKIDYSLFKIDEKGFTYRGRNYFSFDSANVEHMMDNKIAKEQKKVNDLVRQIDKDETALRNLRKEVEALPRAGRRSRVGEVTAAEGKLTKDLDTLRKAVGRLEGAKTNKVNAIKNEKNKQKMISDRIGEKPRKKGYDNSLSTSIRDVNRLNKELSGLINTLGIQ
ncbi:hypothetical protein [Embleya sp. MST-111070]|uniref:hypothetical protein n=1 Tax=Embleya sp. MST-111070 TaxID=3398231 RepID=UPI003F736C35